MTDVIVNHGPINVCMRADTKWFGYLGGILPSCTLGQIPSGHCVLLVGATSDGTTNTNTNFWKYKNSWGPTWGEKGYFRAYKNSSDSTVGYCQFCSSGAFTLPEW